MEEEEIRLKEGNQKPLGEHPGTLSLGRSRSCFSVDTWTRATALPSHSRGTTQQAGRGPSSLLSGTGKARTPTHTNAPGSLLSGL